MLAVTVPTRDDRRVCCTWLLFMVAAIFTWRELAVFVTVAHPTINITTTDKNPTHIKGERTAFLSI
jgi:hypothetical protein